MIDESPLTYHEKILKRLDELIRDLVAENKRLHEKVSQITSSRDTWEQRYRATGGIFDFPSDRGADDHG